MFEGVNTRPSSRPMSEVRTAVRARGIDAGSIERVIDSTWIVWSASRLFNRLSGCHPQRADAGLIPAGTLNFVISGRSFSNFSMQHNGTPDQGLNMDEADFTHRERNRPTVTLLTGNELLGLFFKHFLGEQAQLEVALARLEKIVPGSTDLYLLDSGNSQTEQLSTLLDQLDEQTPVALVNIAPEQAEQLVDKHPTIRGVFYSHATREHLLDGIQVLLDGGDWLPRVLTERLLSQWRRMRQLAGSKPSLTLREREILSLAGKGLSNAEIAEQLCLSPHTIKSHIHNLLRKIGASNRAEAAFLLRGRLDWSESCHA